MVAPRGGTCLRLGAGLGAETELTLAALAPAEVCEEAWCSSEGLRRKNGLQLSRKYCDGHEK